MDLILETVPGPRIEEGPFQMLVSNLDYDSHKGQIVIGRILRGRISPHDEVILINAENEQQAFTASEVFTHMGLKRLKTECVEAGDVVAITGIEGARIGDTLASPENPQALPRIEIGEPTVEMTFGVNTSPFAGREGRFCTTRQLRERLFRELETNLSLRVTDTGSPDTFLVKGRGELHLAVLIETMRREGYEFEISKPEAITKVIDGVLVEPVETLFITTRDEYIGVLTEMLSSRQARMMDMVSDGLGEVKLVFEIPTKGLLGFRSPFLTSTRGESVMNTVFMGYEPWKGEIVSTRNGVLVASDGGVSTSYGLANAQVRGLTFIDPGIQVYEGMIVGLNARPKDIPVNVCKEKKKTNIRSSTSDIAVKITPPVKMDLEQAIDFVNRDELVEITPKNIRLRKKLLTLHDRARAAANAARG
jgi:GTP-binding protein